MSYFTLRKIRFQHRPYFALPAVEKPASISPEEQMKRDAIQAFPGLKDIADKVSPLELYNRAKVMSKLKSMIENPEKTFGKTKTTLNSIGVGNALENLKMVLGLLNSNSKIQDIANTTITAWFKGWDGPGDTNVAVISGTNMSIRMFLGNVLNDSQLVAQLLSAPEKAPESKESEEVHQRTRFGTFLLALETRYPSSDYKVVFRQAHEALGKGDIAGAKELVRKPLKNDWNIDVSSITDAQGHINALRAIGATDEAALRTKEQVKGKIEKRGQLSAKESALITDIGMNLEKEKSQKKDQAEAKYKGVLDALPAHDPLRIQVERNKDVMIAQFSEDMAYMTIMDGFIRKNGSEGLKELGEVYDDMRGLYGTLNFTDENTKMTKEMAVMLASFVLTGGAGALIRGLAVAGRAIAGADALKAVDIASKATAIRQRATQVGNVGRAVGRGIGNGAIQAAEGAQNIGRIASSTRLGAIPAEALKFTTADALLRTAFRAEGERSGFEDYFEKFGKNLLMFSAFAGMEKFVSGPLKEKLLGALTQRGIALNPASTYALGTTVLSGGDVAAMWGLGMAEKGEFHMPEWKGVFQALAFRIGMKGAEKAFPKIAESIQAQVDKRRSSPKKGSASEVAKIEKPQKLSDDELLAQGLKNEIAAVKRGDINITPEALAFKEAQLAKLELKILSPHNPKIESLKTGEQIRFETKNSQYTFEKVPEGYKLTSTSSTEFAEMVGVTFTSIHIAGNRLALMKGKKLYLETSKLKREPIYIDASIPVLRDVVDETGTAAVKRESPGKSDGKVEGHSTTEAPSTTRFRDGAEISRLEGVLITLRAKSQETEKALADFLATSEGRYQSAKTKLESIPKGTGERNIKIENAEFTINKYPDGKKIDVVQHGVGGVKTYSSIEEFLLTIYAKNVEKMLRFDQRITGQNYEMRVAQYKDGTTGMEVKVDGSYRPITGNEKFIKDMGPDARAAFDTYMQHQRDLFQQGRGVHNVTDTHQSMSQGVESMRSRAAQTEADLAAARSLPEQVAPPVLGNERASVQQFDANGRPIDRGAQARMEKEHGIGKPVKSAQESAEVLDVLSFRRDMDALMKMDDATFQKRFTEVQYRKAHGETSNRPHEVEMYEAAANVRKHSDTTIIANAENIIKGNREFLGASRDPKGISNLVQAEKAYLIAENAALRSKLKDIIGRADPALPALVEDAVITGNPTALAGALGRERDKPSNLRRWWPLLLLPLLALALCSGDKKPLIPPGLGGEGEGGGRPTLPNEIAQYCAECAKGPRGTIDFNRKSEVNQSITLSNERREKISGKFMKEGVWQDFLRQYDALKAGLQGSAHPLSQILMRRIEDVMLVASVDNVQDLQHCIAMFDTKTPGSNDLDHQKGQDGILGPITTAKILDAISKCGVAKK